MRNLFRYLSITLIIMVFGLNVDSVSAALECAENETVHTNYYLFLDLQTYDFFQTKMDELTDTQAGLTRWNGADKKNTVPDGAQKLTGPVGITKGSKSTVSGAAVEWTAAEFWEKYYEAWTNVNEDLYYTDGDESYFLHKKWWTYDNANYNGGQQYSHNDDSNHEALMDYINSSSNLASSSLVKDGTAIPESYITAPSGLGESTDPYLRWNIARVYTLDDVTGEGVSLSGINGKYIYAPAVYYAQYCVASAEPIEKTVTYNANSTDAVTNLPGKTTFTDECTTISSKTPVREGYTFLGWSENKNADEADSKYDPEEEYCGESITLYAIWEEKQVTTPKNFTIKYDANGGKDAPASQNGTVGQCLTISSNKPSLEKNTFLGWSTDPKAKEADSNYDAGDQYCGTNGDITLYAVWQVQSGVSAHLIAFGLVAIAAGTAFVIAKKKDLFRQL